MRDFTDDLAGLKSHMQGQVAAHDPQDRRGFSAIVDRPANVLALDWTDRGKCWRKLTGARQARLGGDGGTSRNIGRGGHYRYEARLEGNRTQVRLFSGRGKHEQIQSDWTELAGERVSASGDEQILEAMGKRSTRRSPLPSILALLVGLFAGAWFGLQNFDTPEIPAVNAQDNKSAEALASAQARIKELEREVSNQSALSQALRDELTDLRAAPQAPVIETVPATVTEGPGLSLQPCWLNSQGTHADYIYNVHLSDAGILVSRAFGPERESDYAALPVQDARLDRVMDRYTFAAGFTPLFDASVSQNCRHFVQVHEGKHATADLYKAQRDAVESFFYIYRPGRTRY